nr:ATP-binding protein [uncultured Pseudogulbenkiania sp.]
MKSSLGLSGKLRKSALPLLAWLLLCFLTALLWLQMERSRLEEGFEKDGRAAYVQIARKLDQNEAVLQAAHAMVASRDTSDIAALSAFSREILANYPKLYTILFYQKVVPTERDRYLDQMSREIGEPASITDFDLNRRRSWRAAPLRDVYYPATMVEPVTQASRRLYGYDILHEPRLARELRQAIATGEIVVSMPFELAGDERAYLLMKGVYRNGGPGVIPLRPDSPLVEGVVAVQVHFEQLLAPLRLESQSLNIALYQRELPGVHGSLLLYERSLRPSKVSQWPLFQRFESKMDLPSDAQPFVLSLSRNVTWAELRLSVLVFQELLVTLLLLALWQVYQQRLHLHRARSAADEALFSQRERVEVALNAIRDGVITLSHDRKVEWVNPMAQELLGLLPEQLLGRDYREVLRLQQGLADVSQVDPIGQSFLYQQVVEFPDELLLSTFYGETRLVEGAVAPLFSRTGEMNGAVCAIRDMGPIRRRAQAVLEASESRVRDHLEKLSHVARLHTMGEMASGIAHELNQPLAAISNYCAASLAMLEDVEEAPAQITDALKAAIRQAERSGEIIKRLRAFVSKRSMDVRQVDLNLLVGNSLFLAEHDLRSNGVQVVQMLSANPVTVMADSIQIEQVLMNLLSNAIEAMKGEREGARQLVIHSHVAFSNAILEVRDSGRGISPDVQAVLFHPFYSTREGGMGLGLSICQTIVEQYGGSIEAENIPGSGACFRLRLPFAPPLSLSEAAVSPVAATR